MESGATTGQVWRSSTPGSVPSVQRDASRELLVAAFRSAMAQGDWRQAAVRLNGFNPADITSLAGGVSLGQAAHLRAALLIHLDGWGQQPALLAALDQGGPEVKRIGDLYAQYERAVAAQGWASAADALGPMTRDDIDARLGRLGRAQRDGLAAVAAGREPLTAALRTYSTLPADTTFADIKDDLAYIDNFESASYDVFRRELHLIFEDGHEAPLPISQTRGGAASATTPQLPKQLQPGELTLPTSTGVGKKPGDIGFLTVIGLEVFYHDPQTGLLRPQVLRPAVAPRLYQAVKDLDPDTQDLLFQAGSAFISGGPPLPEGTEWFLLLPALARAGTGVRQSLVKRAEGKVLTQAEASEVRTLVTSGIGKRPYASSAGEIEEAGVMARHAPTATMAPPKMRAVDWYEGGVQKVISVQEKYRGKPITVQETHVSGGTWSQLHTVLEAKDATTANVSAAVTGKLNKFWDRLNNPSSSKPARDPVPIGPDTYRRVYLDRPDAVVVHIHLKESRATKELIGAGQQAALNYAAKSDLPPIRVVVTGK